MKSVFVVYGRNNGFDTENNSYVTELKEILKIKLIKLETQKIFQ